MDIYPNPATDKLKVLIKANNLSNYQLTIRNSLGQLVFKENYERGNKNRVEEINVSHLPKGVYFLNFWSAKHNISRKIMVH